MIEKEYKKILDVNLYNKLDNFFTWDSINKQTNYYYMDIDEKLLNNNVHIRVRKVTDNYKLQIKYPYLDKEKHESVLHVRNEKEKILDSLPEVISGEEIYNLIDFKSKDAKRIGSLVTERKIYNPDKSIKICLDKNYYEDIIDYEIEVEYTCKDDDSKLIEVKSLLSNNGINFEIKTEDKFSRFLTRYLDINKGEGHV